MGVSSSMIFLVIRANKQEGMLMRGCPQLILIAFLMWCLLIAFDSNAATIKAASCSRTDVGTAYNSASSGDTITVPAGTCTWSSTLVITKANIVIQGAGIDVTTIKLGTTEAIRIYSNNVRVTGFTFDRNGIDTGAHGAVVIGQFSTAACGETWQFGDWRIDHNRFINFSVYTTGCNAISGYGHIYGLIDNNVFDNCNGECLNFCADGIYGVSRSNEPGQYAENATVYIEDNTWNYTTGNDFENTIDGNSASRWVIRYNTYNIASGVGGGGLISNHETCATCVCDSRSEGDRGSQLLEVYGNKIYDSGTGTELVTWRAGRLYAYDNTYYYRNPSQLIRAYNLRSEHRADCNAQTKYGYGEFCHADDGSGLIHEGLVLNKTTLNGALLNDTGCPTMTSVVDFPIVGSIIVGTEQIDYTGISKNTLTPCTRGANTGGGAGARAAHSDGAVVHLLLFGVCLDQQNNSYIWNNLYKATLVSAGVANNTVYVMPKTGDGQAVYYQTYDIQSYTQRPANWQYRNDGTAYSYTPYPYPHPLRTGEQALPAAPRNLRIVN